MYVCISHATHHPRLHISLPNKPSPSRTPQPTLPPSESTPTTIVQLPSSPPSYQEYVGHFSDMQQYTPRALKSCTSCPPRVSCKPQYRPALQTEGRSPAHKITTCNKDAGSGGAKGGVGQKAGLFVGLRRVLWRWRVVLKGGWGRERRKKLVVERDCGCGCGCGKISVWEMDGVCGVVGLILWSGSLVLGRCLVRGV
jgi:hypothetical protein